MKRILCACLAVALLVAACTSYSLENDGIALQSPSLTIVVGDTLRLTVTRIDGTVPAVSAVEWSTSDPSVATIDETGVVTAIGTGLVSVAARHGGFDVNLVLRVWSLAPAFTSIAAGAEHSCGLTADGSAWCWGGATYGQLGMSVPPDECPITAQVTILCALGAFPVDTNERFASLALGSFHTCGLTMDGDALCWGWNAHGELGDGGAVTHPTPTPVTGGLSFRSLAAGYGVTCGITTDDEVHCWGARATLVGGADEDSVTAPLHVATGFDFDHVAVAADHACGVATGGATLCWGMNDSGQLGVDGVPADCTTSEGTVSCTSEPQEVTRAPALDFLALDRGFTCGLTADGSAHCWGSNTRGQLGDGTTVARSEPLPVTGGHAFATIAAGRDRACGIDAAGLLFCWGRDEGAFGSGGDTFETHEPIPVMSDLRFTSVAVGLGHACGVSENGVTWCWGANAEGALGSGRTDVFAVVTTPRRVVLRADGT